MTSRPHAAGGSPAQTFMKKLLPLLFLFLTPALKAQAFTHSVTLIWSAGAGNPTGTTYNLYRKVGTCPTTAPTTVAGATGFTKVNTAAITALTTQDLNVTALTSYCYFATAVASSSDTPPVVTESVPSNTSQATIPSTPPAVTTVIIQ